MNNFIFEQRFAKNFNVICGVDLISENKLYGQNIENVITKRLDDDSEEIKNMIAIFGLFRQQTPFKEFGDINNIKTVDQLTELFQKWYKNSLLDIVKTDAFLDNNDGAKKYLDAYVKNIKSLNNNAQPFTLKNIEKSFIDVVNNNKWIEDGNSVGNSATIYEPQDRDIQYEDDNIVILDGNARAKCVLYGKGETWCISQTDQNMFNTYRVTNGATIYFILQKNEESPEHKIVILNYNGQYSIADQTNSGNRTGGSDNAMDWRRIEQELPNLRGKEKFFKYIPVSQEEKNYHAKVAQYHREDNIIKYVTENSENLTLNGSLVTPLDFFTDYLMVAASGKLTDGQFDNLWNNKSSKEVEQMVFKYLSTGVPLNEYQFRMVEKG
jgi:hypothetical protein